MEGYVLLRKKNDPMSSAQAERTQGNPLGPMSIESYFLQIQNFLSSNAHQMTEFRQSALEARVISLQNEINRPNERQGEPSFVVKPFTGEKKERTKKAICTWLGWWESHFELYPTLDSAKIPYVSRELGGKAAAWWRGLRTLGKLPETWTDFVTVFKGQFLQPPSRTEAAQALMNLSSRKFSSLEDYVHHSRRGQLVNSLFCQWHPLFRLSVDSAR